MSFAQSSSTGALVNRMLRNKPNHGGNLASMSTWSPGAVRHASADDYRDMRASFARMDALERAQAEALAMYIASMQQTVEQPTSTVTADTHLSQTQQLESHSADDLNRYFMMPGLPTPTKRSVPSPSLSGNWWNATTVLDMPTPAYTTDNLPVLPADLTTDPTALYRPSPTVMPPSLSPEISSWPSSSISSTSGSLLSMTPAMDSPPPTAVITPSGPASQHRVPVDWSQYDVQTLS